MTGQDSSEWLGKKAFQEIKSYRRGISGLIAVLMEKTQQMNLAGESEKAASLRAYAEWLADPNREYADKTLRAGKQYCPNCFASLSTCICKRTKC